MKNWRPWVVATLLAIVLLGVWFSSVEISAFIDGIPNNTLTAEFMRASCIGVEECTNPNSNTVRLATLALLLGIQSLSAWLIWHFYFEPVRYLKKHGKEIERL
jgi:hypothetical protein